MLTSPAYRRGGLPRPSGIPCFEGGFPLRCLQRLSCPIIATLHCCWRNNRSTSGSFTPVLSCRHRGAKHCRRYGLLGSISLLSPAYLLSVERWPSHLGPPDHYGRLSTLLDLSVSQSGWLLPLHSTSDFRPL